MTTFQDAKDSFYMSLRNGLAALNPDRTTTVRGAVRPAVLTAENELALAGAAPVLNSFVLHWGAVSTDSTEAMPLEHARCTIRVQTAGSPELAGMDRGRMLDAMRAELAAMLAPGVAAKATYSGAAAAAAATPVFWSSPFTEAMNETEEVLTAEFAMDVFAWREP